MSKSVFEFLTAAIDLLFAGVFCVVVVPPLLESGDVVGAALAGFVNPFASGYSTDVILCWFVLAIWILYERSARGIKHGWVCLLLRLRQAGQQPTADA
mgnify:CR=1 FL=1